MRLTETLLATAVVLLASSANLVTASKIAAPGLYAEIYRVEDGVITDKMKVPLGDVDKYKNSDLKQLKNAGTTEDRAAVHLPGIFTRGPIHALFKGFGSFLMKFKKSRRLRIEGP